MAEVFYTLKPLPFWQRKTKESAHAALMEFMRGAHNWHAANQVLARYLELRQGVPDADSRKLAALLNQTAGPMRELAGMVDAAIRRAKGNDTWRPDWPQNMNQMLESQVLWPSPGLGALFLSTAMGWVVVAVLAIVAFVGTWRLTQPGIVQATAQAKRVQKRADAEAERIRDTPPGVPITMPPDLDAGMSVGEGIARGGGVLLGLVLFAMIAPMVLGDGRG